MDCRTLFSLLRFCALSRSAHKKSHSGFPKWGRTSSYVGATPCLPSYRRYGRVVSNARRFPCHATSHVRKSPRCSMAPDIAERTRNVILSRRNASTCYVGENITGEPAAMGCSALHLAFYSYQHHIVISLLSESIVVAPLYPYILPRSFIRVLPSKRHHIFRSRLYGRMA